MSINEELAKIFYRMADILEIKEVAWKPQAYRRAAKALETMMGDIVDVYKKGGIKALEAMPGIGERIGKKIIEYIKTGKVKEYEQLKKQVPRGLLDMMEVVNLGPKRVKKLYDLLGVKSIAQLKRAAQAGKIATLPGFGERSEQIILESLGIARKTRRLPLKKVLPIALRLERRLKKIPGVQRASLAGSVRRRKSTVKDIDLLASSKTPKKVIEAFVKFPEIKTIVAKGPTKASVRLKRPDIAVDLRVVKDESFGSALQYFTGPKEHNIRLRNIAIRKGYKLNEYGLFDRKSGKKIAGKEEKEIYKILNQPLPKWISGSLRRKTKELK